MKAKPKNLREQSPLNQLGALYHDYSFFGHRNKQKPGIYPANQSSKEPIILSYMAYAIAQSSLLNDGDVSFAEMFCADGYYAMAAAALGCATSVGMDNNRDGHFTKAQETAAILNLPQVTFETVEISPEAQIRSFDVVANVGGLYHVDDPEGILEKSYAIANKFLIVQTVVTLANNDPDYYAAPAPGWTWGNRYSQASFDRMMRSKYEDQILFSQANELKGNGRASNRGSVYYLIKKV